MKFLRIIVVILVLTALVIPYSAVSAETTKEPEGFQWDISKEALLASLWEADIASIHEAYEMGWITCTELTAYYLERIDEYNDTYNCFITICNDALEQAQKCDEAMAAGEAKGALFGIPMVIKDNMHYLGYYTTNGYNFSPHRLASRTAPIVQYILQEGAIIIGKTNMSTNAQDARTSTSLVAGETKNAYNAELASGGSSGGSAVATSLNFALAGLGTDTNSSLRLPAVLNGCVSLRSTTGRLNSDGIIKLNFDRDVPGVITRTVMDQAIILDTLSNGTTHYAENLNENALQGLRIGVLYEYTYAIGGQRSERNIDDEVAAAFENAVKEFETLGAEVVMVHIPDALDLAEHSLVSHKISDIERMHSLVMQAMEENDVSALIFPTYLSTPLRSGWDSNGKYWYASNQTFINNARVLSSCAGIPEIAIPIGYHSLGAGIGMEIAALKNEEQLLLDIAYTYTQNFDHRRATDNAPDLYADHYQVTLGECVASYYAALEQYEEELRLAAEEAARQEAEKQQQEEAERREEEIKQQQQDALQEQESALQEQEAAQQREELLKKQRTARVVILVLAVVIMIAAVALILLICTSRKRGKYSK